jgi:hypothetical protein
MSVRGSDTRCHVYQYNPKGAIHQYLEPACSIAPSYAHLADHVQDLGMYLGCDFLLVCRT